MSESVVGGHDYRIEGSASGRRARIDIDGARLRWEWLGDGAPPGAVEVRLDEPFTFVAREENRGGIVIGFGLFFLALAALWLANASAGPAAIAGAAVAGAALVAMGARARRTVIELRAPAIEAEMSCAGRARAAARDAADFLRLRNPGAARRESSRTFMAFIAREAQALVARRAQLRNEYLALAGADATAETEARFVSVRRVIAAWNLAWLVGLPLLLAVAAWLAWPTNDGTWRALRSLLVFLAASFVGLRLLPRLQPLLKRAVRSLEGDGGRR